VDRKCNCEDSKVAGSDIQPTSLSLIFKILGKSFFSFYHLVRALTTVLAVISVKITRIYALVGHIAAFSILLFYNNGHIYSSKICPSCMNEVIENPREINILNSFSDRVISELFL